MKFFLYLLSYLQPIPLLVCNHIIGKCDVSIETKIKELPHVVRILL